MNSQLGKKLVDALLKNCDKLKGQQINKGTHKTVYQCQQDANDPICSPDKVFKEMNKEVDAKELEYMIKYGPDKDLKYGKWFLGGCHKENSF